jgi:histone H3/H4
MSSTIVVRTKIKELTDNFSVSSDFGDALDEKVKSLVTDAMRRAEANGRKTIMSKDL